MPLTIWIHYHIMDQKVPTYFWLRSGKHLFFITNYVLVRLTSIALDDYKRDNQKYTCKSFCSFQKRQFCIRAASRLFIYNYYLTSFYKYLVKLYIDEICSFRHCLLLFSLKLIRKHNKGKSRDTNDGVYIHTSVRNFSSRNLNL